jgi:hypothetical protein
MKNLAVLLSKKTNFFSEVKKKTNKLGCVVRTGSGTSIPELAVARPWGRGRIDLLGTLRFSREIRVKLKVKISMT